MDGNVGTLHVRFEAEDKGVQATINRMINSINNAQSKVRNIGNAVNTTTNQINNNISRVNSGVNGLSSTLRKMGQITSLAIVGKQISNLGAKIITLGSDMSETENLFQVSFGSLSEQADAFANRLNMAWGVDTTSIKENIAFMNQMFTSMKFGSSTAYTMSTEMEKLSYNISSLYNISQADAFQKLQSGLVGNVRPLRALGINVDNATIKQYAMEKGIASNTANMTNQQKVLARYEAILDQTTNAWNSNNASIKNGEKAIGDLSKTITNPQNQLRILQSQLITLGRYWGLAFLPIITVVVPYINTFVRILTELGKTFAGFMARLFGVGTSWKDIVGDFKTGKSVAQDMGDAVKSVGDNSTSSAKKTSKALDKTNKKLKTQLASFDKINNLTKNASSTSGGSGGGGGSGGANVGYVQGLDFDVTETDDPSPLVDKLTKKIIKALKPLTNYLKSVGNVLKELFKSLAVVFKSAWDNGGSYLFKAIGNLIKKFLEFGTTINNKVVAPLINSFGRFLAPMIGKTIGGGLKTLGNIINVIGGSFSNLLTTITGLTLAFNFSSIVTALTSVSTALTSVSTVLSTVLMGAIKGIITLWTSVALAGVGQTILFLVKSITSLGSGLLNVLNPITAIASAIVLFTTAFVNLYTSSENFRNSMNKIFGATFKNLKNIITQIIGIFTNLYNLGIKPVIDNMVALFKKMWSGDLKSSVMSLSKFMGNLFNLLLSFIGNVILPLGRLLTSILAPILSTLFNLTVNIVGTVGSKLLNLASKLLASLNPLLRLFSEKILPVIGSFINMISGGIGKALGFLSKNFTSISKNIISGFVDGILFLPKKIVGIFSSMVKAVCSFLGIHSPSRLFKKLADFVVTGFLNGLKIIVKRVKKVFSDVWNGIKSVFSSVKKWFKENIVDNILGAFDGIGETISGFFGGAFDGISSGVTDAINGALDFGDNVKVNFEATLSGAWQTVQDVFSIAGGIVKKTFEAVGSGVSTVWNGIKEAWNTVSNTVKKTFTASKDKVSEIWKGIKDIWNKSSNTVKKTFTSIGDKVKSVWNNIKSIWDKKGSTTTKTFTFSLSSAFKKAWNWMVDIGNKGASAVKALANIIGISIPSSLPKLASGGIAYGDTLALIGEYRGARTNPEVVSPLNKLTGLMDSSIRTATQESTENLLRKISSSGVQQRTETQDRIVHATFNLNGREFLQAVVEEDKKVKRSTGKSAFSY